MNDDDDQLGRCDYCGGGVWPDMEHVEISVGGYYHRGCAENLRDALGAVL